MLAVLFNACSLPKPMMPQEINKRAIPPSKRIKLFSPPPNGYARLIMYRDYVFRYSGKAFNVYTDYSYITSSKKSLNNTTSRALCKISNDSSCIVNIRAGKQISLVHEEKVPVWIWVLGGVLLSPLILTLAAVSDGSVDTMATFTPKNQHIYCIDFTIGDSFRQFKDGRTCLKEYKAIYKPKHRKEQDEWFDELLEASDERAYME